MATSPASGLSLLRIALLATAALTLAPVASGAPVGVTSATDGDPLGKPPAENERVLRIGIDVQANEVVRTNANDRAHLVFLDGTSVTVGPNAQLTIDRFVYDPDTKKGELAINASKGVFRLVGGKISKSNAITIATPSSTIGIRGGISIFSVDNRQTIANFIFGTSMSVTGAGQTTMATRPGTQVITNFGAVPGPPILLPPGALKGDMAQLETGKSTGGNIADQGAQKSGFSGKNSGQPVLMPPLPGQPNNIQQQVNTAVSTATDQAQPGATTPVVSQPSEPTKQTQTLNGYANGLITHYDGTNTTVNAPQVIFNKPTDLTISTNAGTGRASGTIIIRGIDGTISSPTLTLQLGSLNNSNSSFFIDDKNYGMATSSDPGRQSTVKPLSGPATKVDATNVLVSYAGIPDVPVSGTPGTCACEYLSWGWWATAVTYTSGDRAGQTDIVALAPYVAGKLANSVNLPQTGSATYTGVMAGNVQKGSQTYNAAGSYNSTWSFAARNGSFNASFDNNSYQGRITAQQGSGGVSFSGAFNNGSGGGLNGTLSGSFFSAPGDAAKYQAGAFSIGGSGYKAGGVFAGQRN